MTLCCRVFSSVAGIGVCNYSVAAITMCNYKSAVAGIAMAGIAITGNN
jgi:hypothetical protein